LEDFLVAANSAAAPSVVAEFIIIIIIILLLLFYPRYVFPREEKIIIKERKMLILQWPVIRAVLVSKALVQQDSVLALY